MGYNGSYTMMAKPMKTLEMYYPMIQFLIMNNITGEYQALSEEMLSKQQVLFIQFTALLNT